MIMLRSVWIAGLLFSAAAADAADAVNGVAFKPMFNPERGLELHVQNYSKLPKKLDAVDVYIGGTEAKAACHVAVPGIEIAPAARTMVVVADARTINGCLPGGAPARTPHQLEGLENIPSKNGAPSTAPLKFDRSVRILPRFGGALAGEPAQLRFRLAN